MFVPRKGPSVALSGHPAPSCPSAVAYLLAASVDSRLMGAALCDRRKLGRVWGAGRGKDMRAGKPVPGCRPHSRSGPLTEKVPESVLLGKPRRPAAPPSLSPRPHASCRWAAEAAALEWGFIPAEHPGPGGRGTPRKAGSAAAGAGSSGTVGFLLQQRRCVGEAPFSLVGSRRSAPGRPLRGTLCVLFLFPVLWCCVPPQPSAAATGGVCGPHRGLSKDPA